MTEKSISEQIVDEFIGEVAKKDILDTKRLYLLKTVLNTDKPKKDHIIKALKEEIKDEDS